MDLPNLFLRWSWKNQKQLPKNDKKNERQLHFKHFSFRKWKDQPCWLCSSFNMCFQPKLFFFSVPVIKYTVSGVLDTPYLCNRVIPLLMER